MQAPETSQSLDWADLRTLDLSEFDRPGGKHSLASQFQKAIEEVGTSMHSRTHGHTNVILIITRRLLLRQKPWPEQGRS